MVALEARDYFTDRGILQDPYAFFEAVRAHGPVYQPPGRDYLIVTGFDETLEVLANAQDFSAVNALQGAAAPLPFDPQGSDISAQLEAHRPDFPGGTMLVGLDDMPHTMLRGLVNRLFTPSRLKANERFISDYSDHLVRQAVARGRTELIRDIATPFVTLVIADLLGIPAKGRAAFRVLLEGAVPAQIDGSPEDLKHNPLVGLGKHMFRYIAWRRFLNHPAVLPVRRLLGAATERQDILPTLAPAPSPDGTSPTLVDLTAMAAFLFGAGQDTTNRLLANAFRIIAIRPDIQAQLRADPKRIPNFLEEVLRYDGSVKSGGRICTRTTELGGVEIKAGTTILMSHMAANRDPRRFDNPAQFDMDRPRAKEHLAFGRGAHTCIGAPLARREVAVSIERLLARMGNIRLSPAHHGSGEALRFDYEPTYILRALRHLHLEFDPIADPG